MENNVANILAGCLNNERKSQKEFYQLFHKSVFSVCYRYEYRLEYVEQLVNESFIRIFKKLDGHQRSQFSYTDLYQSLQVWIRQIVICTCIENYRMEQTNSGFQYAKDETGKNQKIPKNSNNVFSHKQLIEAIRKLPPKGRMIYNLYAIEGMGHVKIAGHLNISIPDSRITLAKTRKKLKRSLFGEPSREQNKTSPSHYPLINVEDSLNRQLN